MLGKIIKKKVEIEVEVGKCEDCHFRGIDGGPGPVMVCEHPDATGLGYIISWNNERTRRFSDECPLDDEKRS